MRVSFFIVSIRHEWGHTNYGLRERLNGIQEVSGSIPLISTSQKPRTKVLGFFVRISDSAEYARTLRGFGDGWTQFGPAPREDSIPLISAGNNERLDLFVNQAFLLSANVSHRDKYTSTNRSLY